MQKARKKLMGNVIEIHGAGTLKVRVERKMTHPLYKKIIKKHKNYLVNYTGNDVKVNDQVYIAEGRPMSKSKTFIFVKKVK